MKTNAAALDIITTFEGFSAAPYRCPAGVWTVGFGATRQSDGAPVTASTPPLDEAGAMALLRHELTRTERAVHYLVRVALNENRFGALVSLVYNIGSGNFRASTLRQKLARGDLQGAAAEFPKWRRAGGRILSGLVRRRRAERALFLASPSP